MAKTIEERLDTLATRYYNADRRLRNTSLKFLKKLLKEGGNIVLDSNRIPEYVSVPYDGGNHPEYASNVFSTVNEIYLDLDGEIMLNIEDADRYSVDNVSTGDLYNIVGLIIKYRDKL